MGWDAQRGAFQGQSRNPKDVGDKVQGKGNLESLDDLPGGVQDEVPQELIEAEQAEIKEALIQLQDFAVDGESAGSADAPVEGGGGLPGLSGEQLPEGQEVNLPKASDRCTPSYPLLARKVAFCAIHGFLSSCNQIIWCDQYSSFGDCDLYQKDVPLCFSVYASWSNARSNVVDSMESQAAWPHSKHGHKIISELVDMQESAVMEVA